MNSVRSETRASSWVGPALPAALIAALIAALYAAVLPGWAADLWNDPDYSHGLLVPFVSAWLVYERREQLGDLTPRPALSGLFWMVTGLGILLAGLLGAEFFLSRASLVVLLTGLLVLNLGYPYLRALALPIAFLLFAIPLPEILLNSITFPLQVLASKLAVGTLQSMGIPSLREGNVILLPNGALEVVEACSGLRSLAALTATAVLIAFLMLRRWPGRLMVIALSVPIAVLLNGLRIAATGFLAYHFGSAAAEGFFHSFSGWIVFVAALATLSLGAWPLRRLEGRA